MPELQPPIYISNIRIGEPVTAITDILVTVVCFYAFIKLKSKTDSVTGLCFRYYFLLLGVATLWGGLITHAFIYALSIPWKIPGWIISTWAISLMAYGMVRHHKKRIEKISIPLIWLIGIELFFVMGITIYTNEFKWAGAHSAFGLVLITGTLSLTNYFKTADQGSLLVVKGIGIFIISGVIFSAKLSIHTWFNHVDLAHVVIAIASYYIHLGVDFMLESEPNQQSID